MRNEKCHPVVCAPSERGIVCPLPSLFSPPLTTYTPRLPPIGRDFGISIAFFAHAQWLVTVSFVGDLLVTHGKESQAAGRMSDKLQDYGNPGGRYSVALIGDEEGYVACEKEKLTGGREGNSRRRATAATRSAVRMRSARGSGEHVGMTESERTHARCHTNPHIHTDCIFLYFIFYTCFVITAPAHSISLYFSFPPVFSCFLHSAPLAVTRTNEPLVY